MTSNFDLEFTTEAEQTFHQHSTAKVPAHIKDKEAAIWASIREANGDNEDIGYLFH